MGVILPTPDSLLSGDKLIINIWVSSVAATWNDIKSDDEDADELCNS